MLIPRPGVRFGPYPERPRNGTPWSSYHAELAYARLHAVRAPSAREKARFVAAVHAKRDVLNGCDIEFIAASAKRLRSRLNLEGMTPELVAEVFALIDACMRFHLKITLHDTQLVAAWLLLDRRLVEMQTGEGKTLAVALAAVTGALAGIPVHVVTANDYLVTRDAAILTPVCQTLGLSVGAIVGTTPGSERPRIYRSDITYCTAKELAFDYLRDHLATAENDRPSPYVQQNLRGLCMAIVDEADNVLIDEARMPLILSGHAPATGQEAFYRQALFLAAQLKPKIDYQLNHAQRSAALTAAGRERAKTMGEHMGGAWRTSRRREEMLCYALAAQHLFLKERHYLVIGNEVIIIDDNTGRTAPGRVWSQGLHQLIETKENCKLTQQQHTVAQTTFQRFFLRYLRLSGISGTVSEARNELLAVYGLPVATVSLQFPSQRRMLPGRVFADTDAQWRYVVSQVMALRAAGRPVLIGTDSVNDSETLSARLTQAGVPHAVLNARFDAEEARIIAAAGQAGAVTVSTNMAGRGTDIRLDAAVRAAGGLHVIACQANDSRRIDRQLYGRCGRQGEPGSVEHLYCLGDSFAPLPKTAMAKAAASGLRRAGNEDELPQWFVPLARLAQRLRERRRRREQWFLLLRERQMDTRLAFAGESE
ncbi:MAG TPA: DEAD/DEAH box helicase [Noviherbaspirillum sp.]|nr:DEAD/DEAH box helicase [Noviherbaspirillum sp.]